MAKRGAEEQISKDDFESRRGDDSDEDVSRYDKPLVDELSDSQESAIFR